jgi:hypothetical protein
VAAAAGEYYTLNLRIADQARFSSALINAVL